MTTPRLPGRVIHTPDVDLRIEKVTSWVTRVAMESVAAKGSFHLALPADVPHTLDAWYTALVIDPRWRGMPWSKTHIWQAAETVRGGTWQTLQEALLAHLPLEENNLHAMDASGGDPLDALAEQMETVFGDQPPRMDLAITTEATLAMAHVAIDSWQLAAAHNVLIWTETDPMPELVKAAGYFEGGLAWVLADGKGETTPTMIDLV